MSNGAKFSVRTLEEIRRQKRLSKEAGKCVEEDEREKDDCYGGWWWVKHCGYTGLTGRYERVNNPDNEINFGMFWLTNRITGEPRYHTFRIVEMKIAPRDKQRWRAPHTASCRKL